MRPLFLLVLLSIGCAPDQSALPNMEARPDPAEATVGGAVVGKVTVQRKGESGRLLMRLVDESGQGIEGIQATLKRAPRSELLSFDACMLPDSKSELLHRVTESRASGELVFEKVDTWSDFFLTLRGDTWKAIRFRVAGLRPGETRQLGDVNIRSAYEVYGSVLDSFGLPVVGAKVSLRSLATSPEIGRTFFGWPFAYGGPARGVSSKITTDEDGFFKYPGIRSGSYRLDVTPAGLPRANKTIEVSGEQRSNRVDFKLEKGVLFSGRVEDEDGNAIPGAKVALVEKPNSDLYADYQTEILEHGELVQSDGSIELWSEVPIYATHIAATATGYRGKFSKDLRSLREDVTLILKKRPVVSGMVVDADGLPIENALAVMFDASNNQSPTALCRRTDLNGVFHFGSKSQGDFVITVVAPEGEIRAEIKSSAAEASDRVMQIPSGADLKIRVQDENGQPVSAARLTLESWRDEAVYFAPATVRAEGNEYLPRRGPRRFGRTDQNGEVVFGGLEVGAAVVRIQKLGFANHVQEIEIPNNFDDVFQFELQPESSIHLIAGTRSTFPKVPFQVIRSGGFRYQYPEKNWDGRGHWSLTGLPAGEYIISSVRGKKFEMAIELDAGEALSIELP